MCTLQELYLLLTSSLGITDSKEISPVYLVLIRQQLRVPTVQGTPVHLHGKEEAGHGVERALRRGLGLLRPNPLSPIKQLHDLGKDTCFYWVSVLSSVN